MVHCYSILSREDGKTEQCPVTRNHDNTQNGRVRREKLSASSLYKNMEIKSPFYPRKCIEL
jgi:hypothetical protein